MPQTWTVDERITYLEHQGMITVPFTPDERALAQAAAEASHFAFWLQELPGRIPNGTLAFVSMERGIEKVRERRGDVYAPAADTPI
jgi:hypothetical protein